MPLLAAKPKPRVILGLMTFGPDTNTGARITSLSEYVWTISPSIRLPSYPKSYYSSIIKCLSSSEMLKLRLSQSLLFHIWS
jgi:hypothetical protein